MSLDGVIKLSIKLKLDGDVLLSYMNIHIDYIVTHKQTRIVLVLVIIVYIFYCLPNYQCRIIVYVSVVLLIKLEHPYV